MDHAASVARTDFCSVLGMRLTVDCDRPAQFFGDLHPPAAKHSPTLVELRVGSVPIVEHTIEVCREGFRQAVLPALPVTAGVPLDQPQCQFGWRQAECDIRLSIAGIDCRQAGSPTLSFGSRIEQDAPALCRSDQIHSGPRKFGFGLWSVKLDQRIARHLSFD